MALAAALGALGGCGHDNGGSSQPLAGDATALTTPSHENHLLGEDKSATAGDSTGAGVNAYLWRGAIDTLSFMPFASAEPEGGIIITDWYSPPTTTGERFKANAYILGKPAALGRDPRLDLPPGAAGRAVGGRAGGLQHVRRHHREDPEPRPPAARRCRPRLRPLRR